MKRNQHKIEVEVGSGNVFADLGFENAEKMAFKSKLVRQINREIKARNLTTARVKNLLQIDDEMLANLSRGRLTELTLEHLFRYLNILGRDLEVVLKFPSTSSSQGKIETRKNKASQKPRNPHPGNVRRSNEAVERIATAHAAIKDEFTAETKITQRCERLRAKIQEIYGITVGTTTLNRHKNIWHPKYLGEPQHSDKIEG
jgi:predicted XRE-type DNA-binding protein